MGLDIAVVIIVIFLLRDLWVGLRDRDPVFAISANSSSGAKSRQVEKNRRACYHHMTSGDSDVEQVASNSPGSLEEFNQHISTREPSQAILDGDFGPDFADEPEAQEALTAIESGANCIFILGRAGTGKTTLVRHIMRSSGDATQVVLAPTGIAAINVQGQTIHSFFRLPPRLLDRDNLEPSRRNRLWRRIDRIIIDEVSMVRVDVMDAMDAVLRKDREDDRPFGGVQMVFVGDFLQLPPVVRSQEAEMLFQLGYTSPYCFSAKSLAEFQPTIVHLPTVRRQTDPFFIEQLGKLRNANEVESALAELNKRCARPHRTDAEPMLLTGTNARASYYNQAGLDMIDDEPAEYDARTTGTFDQHAGRLPVPETLVLKPGARVMALKNDPKSRWVNGSLGTVTELEGDRVWMRLDSGGSVVDVERQSWENIRYKWDQVNKKVIAEVVGSFTQMPLNLAWAATIHKAQGLSLDDVRIDLEGGAFASGQAYVAISRARSLDGLSLSRPLRPSDVFIDPLLSEFDQWTQSQILLS